MGKPYFGDLGFTEVLHDLGKRRYYINVSSVEFNQQKTMQADSSSLDKRKLLSAVAHRF